MYGLKPDNAYPLSLIKCRELQQYLVLHLTKLIGIFYVFLSSLEYLALLLGYAKPVIFRTRLALFFTR